MLLQGPIVGFTYEIFRLFLTTDPFSIRTNYKYKTKILLRKVAGLNAGEWSVMSKCLIIMFKSNQG